MRINRGTTCEKDKERGRRWKEEERRAGPCQSGSGSRVGGSERKERCGCMRGLGGAAGEGAARARRLPGKRKGVPLVRAGRGTHRADHGACGPPSLPRYIGAAAIGCKGGVPPPRRG